uniref:THAP-type domain-containing protein n=1 Tax=Cyprinus carpio TaxID=7962 RepID=A0A8C2J6K0_CYPCA
SFREDVNNHLKTTAFPIWEGFVVTESSKLCSEHFKPDDFDRTGQIVSLRDGVTPSVFNFPCHLQRGVFLLYMITEIPAQPKVLLKKQLEQDSSQIRTFTTPQKAGLNDRWVLDVLWYIIVVAVSRI